MPTYPWGNAPPDCSKAMVGMAKGTGTLSCVEWPMQCHGVLRVGTLPGSSSPYGVEDMIGPDVELTSDWYSANWYRVSPKDNPHAPRPPVFKQDGGAPYVTRGAHYWNSAANVQAWRRYTFSDSAKIRCARSLPSPGGP